MTQSEEHGTALKWMPTLYFTKGLLHVVVFVVALIMLKQSGLTNGETTFSVALCYLPWALKFWWKPKFNWHRYCWLVILLSELSLVLAFSFLAFALPTLWITVVLLLLIASLTAMHNVAVDTYYSISIGNRSSSRCKIIRELSRKLAEVVGIGVLVMLVGNLQVVYRNAQLFSWRTTSYIIAFICMLLFFWHLLVLPRRTAVALKKSSSSSDLSATSVVFLLTYLFATVMQGKMAILFLTENQSSGGLGLSPQEFGFVMGTVGVIGLTVGLILGGKLIHRFSMLRLLLPMSLTLFVPSVIYVILSFFQPDNFALICLSVQLEQIAYGLGLSVYLAYQNETANTEQAKSLMACSMMLACALSGLIQMQLGYYSFFLVTLLLSLLGTLSVWMTRKY